MGMQNQRLFEIIYLLQNRKSMTAKQLADYFEVSVRTILRDIDTLSSAGVPIYTTQGKGGGISLMEGYVLNKTLLTEAEQNHLLFALQSLSAADYLNTADTLRKFQSLFAKTDTHWIEVDFSRWGTSTADQEKFDTLKNAIIGKQAVHFSYSNSAGVTMERTAYPLRLLFKARSWYLQAYCLHKQSVRVFKINRLQNLKLLEESFDGMAFDIPPMSGMVPHPSTYTDFQLKFAPQLAYRVYDEFDGNQVTQNGDGSLTVCIAMPADEWLYQYVLSFGENVEVLSPPSIRSEIARRAAAIYHLYAPS